MTLPLLDSIVYGPVVSRRLGRSLGVNILPANLKVCNFDCSYCQYGGDGGASKLEARPGRWPSPEAVANAVGAALRLARSRGDSVERLTLAGHGEPTLHPQFEEVVDRLVALRDVEAPGVILSILSNSSTAGWPSVRRALCRLDERFMKLDAGEAGILRRLNGREVCPGGLVAVLRALPDIVIQAMFVEDLSGEIGNAGEAAIASWLGAVRRIEPLGVHVYTIDRAPAWPSLRPLPAARLKEIACRVRAAGIPATTFPSRQAT